MCKKIYQSWLTYKEFNFLNELKQNYKSIN